MRFTCNTKELKAALSTVIHAVSKKDTVPAIKGVLIECENYTVKLTCYDFEVGITTNVKANVEEGGSIVINAEWLNKELRKLNKDNIMFEAVGTSVTISYTDGKGGTCDISGIDAEEYPELPSVSGGQAIMVDKELLQGMIKQTIYAVSDKENSKPVHTGLKFEIGENSIRLIGVDGYRLAICTETINYDGEDISFVVPKKTVQEIANMPSFGNEKENITISVGKRHILFEIGGFSIISRLLEGEFLDYNAAIPKTCSTTVWVKTGEFLDCIERTTPTIEDSTRNPIRCMIENGEIRVSTVSGIGRSVDRIDAEIEGDRVEIGFNSQFMHDALHYSETDKVKIELSGPIGPAKVMPETGDSFLFLVLPMRLRNNETDNR